MSALTKEIRSFVVIAHEKSVRKAADKLHIAASALSRQVKILEEDFGSKLLLRLPKGIELTEQGQALYKQAQKWMTEENRLRRSLEEEHKPHLLQLRIGAVGCLSHSFLPRLYKKVSSVLGHVRIHFKTGDTQTLTDLLLNNELDFIIAFNVVRNEKIHFAGQYMSKIGLVHLPELLNEGKQSIELQDCLKWPLCFPDVNLSVHTRLYSEILRQKSSFDIAATSNSFHLLANLVINGIGVSFMTWYDIEKQVKEGKLAFTPLTDKRLEEELCVCLPSTVTINEQTQSVIDSIHEVIQLYDHPAASQ
ncbi:LysR family transcriptional regulator [Psychromonas sp. 14N.309.X.WAT.B.A12]|uniref:LysR family transcriptional regulator n=1 Tax=Psychromonas sp. 14N.309.X.WAT.B.A12 TaxID=2998322 RepID=UPI0025B0B735|nr:LysR family transcriptional regulator [Psychromonas sp. 14N.309.X.WAT.B.A12]MDN2662630.1 LysR family transcriptional regulator [Psychromonas sp. 14N.309.X.WAT.B.A12]